MAVANGCGIAGCHGGMEYTVNISGNSSPITEGLKDFTVSSEQYYLHADPAVKILATTRFPVVPWYHSSNGDVDMPAALSKTWGAGWVFYTSLGHQADIFNIPEVMKIMVRGMLWAAGGKEITLREGLTSDQFKSKKKMF